MGFPFLISALFKGKYLFCHCNTRVEINSFDPNFRNYGKKQDRNSAFCFLKDHSKQSVAVVFTTFSILVAVPVTVPNSCYNPDPNPGLSPVHYL